MSDPKKKEEPAVIAMIAGLEKGATAAELETVVREAVTASMLTKKPASVTLKIVIAAGDDDSVRVTPDIGKTLPKLPRKSQTFFVGEGGELSRSSRSQGEFPETQRAEMAAEAAKVEKAEGAGSRFRVMESDGMIKGATATA